MEKSPKTAQLSRLVVVNEETHDEVCTFSILSFEYVKKE